MERNQAIEVLSDSVDGIWIPRGESVEHLDEHEHGVDRYEEWHYVRRESDGVEGYVLKNALVQQCRTLSVA